jgi:hypothetical protein
MDNWLGWAVGSWLGWVTTPTPVPAPAPVLMRATSERYYMRRDKFNQYFEEDIPLEDALLLWWEMLNSE